jgi:hypothetical protein
MRKYFTGQRSFSSLSVTDLLEAQEVYHIHLAHLDNVVATAVGRFRIRDTDADFRAPQYGPPAEPEHGSVHGSPQPRTLSNTKVRPWSWPCLLVFVKHWMTDQEMRDNPTQVVPPFIYLPDGRVIPTCVLYSEEPMVVEETLPDARYPDGLLGGSCPMVSKVQGRDHTGTVACLVSNGDLTFALTNRHVSGPKGRTISAVAAGGNLIPIGQSAGRDAGKIPFSEAYPSWPGARTCLNLDAGLIELRSLVGWTTQVYGVGELDEPVNLNMETLSLDIIGCPLKAYGGASGELEGRIQALFYRYRSIGGLDYVSDLLIGPRYNAEPLPTREGDSGTLWVFDEAAALGEDEDAPGRKGTKPSSRRRVRDVGRAPRLRPVAIQWGGHVFVGGEGKRQYPYALATCLSTVCRVLDVEVIRDWNIGHSEYWGQLGHYKIATAAIDCVQNAALKDFLTANLSNISFDDDTLSQGKYHSPKGTRIFPLADVPDLVWKGFGTKRKALEHPNHFADMDQKDPNGVDLLQLSDQANNIDSRVWNAFYESIGVAEGDRGLLPFRVWQIFDAMVDALSKRDAKNFLIAAGTIAHYCGDSCQPLHISQFFDGRTEAEKGVHSAYETTMLDRNKVDVIRSLADALRSAPKPSSTVQSGHDAAVLVARVMQSTFKALPPDTIIDSYDRNQGDAHGMWGDLKDDTVQCMAAGCLALAAIWEGAWAQGGPLPANLGELDANALADIYHEDSCLPSMTLPQMVQQNLCTLTSQGGSPVGPSGPAPHSRRRHTPAPPPLPPAPAPVVTARGRRAPRQPRA